MNETKKWWQSKIVALFTALGIYGIFQAVQGFTANTEAFVENLTQVELTAEQLQVVQNSIPEIVTAFEQAQQTNQYGGLIITLASIAGSIFRIWFTPKILPQSIRNK